MVEDAIRVEELTDGIRIEGEGILRLTDVIRIVYKEEGSKEPSLASSGRF